MKLFFQHNFQKAFFLSMIVLASALNVSAKEKDIIVKSPDGNAVIRLDYSKGLMLSVEYNNQQVMAPSPVSMSINEHPDAFVNPTWPKIKQRTINTEIIPPVAEKHTRNPYI